ncbi:YidB family protein [Piscinibacter terrae]|uniref:DUF937 domain-containing protein n=1 Tax=Piscinibacter terrae TaxID=2496871 RepID=A0A3N7HPR9_9BURK|nr:YidB family protein [Albitalea terrae]RQP23126.1 DUF937 domain-containing protein [Albitalea terrae]
MGLLDSLVGQVMGASGGSSSPHAGVVDAIGSLIQQHPDGLSGLITVFEQKGLGGVVASWVGTGSNLPISAQQLQAVLGSEQVQAIANQLGIPADVASGHLAELLPQVIDQLTPGGAVPDSGALGGLLGMLRK